MKRCFRLKKSKEITAVYRGGKRVFSSTVTLIYRISKKTSYAVCVGKKYGKSVQRNKIKRLLREAFALYGKDISPPATLLLIPKVRDSYSVSSFSKDLRYLFEKEKIIDRTEGADRR